MTVKICFSDIFYISLQKTIMDKKELDRQYYLKNKTRILERRKQRYQENKEKELEQSKRYHNDHKKEITEYLRQYNIDNNDKLRQYKQDYYNTMHGRSLRLANHYKREDSKFQRGECTIDAQWIIDNIFTKSCVYCGESDWHKLGCDRKDSSLPHTPDNCVASCIDCNRKKQTMSYDEYMKKILGEPNS